MREIDRLGAMMDSSKPVAFFFKVSGQVSVPPLDPDLDPPTPRHFATLLTPFMYTILEAFYHSPPPC